MRLIPFSACKRMPWKNGGGVTTEVAIEPEGASLDDFGWRISMAQVTQDGPFSCFPGVDRTLAVLAGQGIKLDFADGEIVNLDRASKPFAFAADRSVHSVLRDGPVEDLNVMTRRSAWTHSVQKVAGPASHRLPCQSGFLLVLAWNGDWSASAGSEDAILGPGDSAVVTAPASITVRAPDQGILFAVHLVRADPAHGGFASRGDSQVKSPASP